MNQRQTKVLLALRLKDGQTFTELNESIKKLDKHGKGIDNHSFRRGLIELQAKKLIKPKDDDNRYWINFKIKNKTLLALKDAYTTARGLEVAIRVIKEVQNPYDHGFLLICHAMRRLTMLTLERHLAGKLSYCEKEEFENFNVLYNTVIEVVIDILRKQPKNRMKQLKKALTLAMFDPNLLSSLNKTKVWDKMGSKILSVGSKQLTKFQN